MTKRARGNDGESGASKTKFTKVARVILVPFDRGQCFSLDKSNAFAWDRGPRSATDLRTMGAVDQAKAIVRNLFMKELDLSSNSFLSEGELIELSGLQRGVLCPFLEKVNLATTRVSALFLDLLTAVAPNLHTIDLSSCAMVSDDALILLAARCRQIRSLKLAKCALVTDASLEFFLAKHGAGLVDLDLANCNTNVSNKTATSIAAFAKALTSLSLRATSINHAGIAEIVDGCRQLQKFDLAAARIDGFLLRVIAKTLSDLRMVNISFCFEINESDVRSCFEQDAAIEIAAFGLEFSDAFLAECALRQWSLIQ